MARSLSAALLALAALGALAALVKLQPLWRGFDTVPVPMERPDQPETAGDRLDAVLLRHLPRLGALRAFDHVFAGGSRALRLAKPLWVDVCEVRQGDFYKFAQWRPFRPDLSIAAPGQPADWRHFSNTREHAISGRLDGPANGVAWYDAYAYCEAAGGRLPSADEWIAAASGKEGRLYPWGDAFDGAAWPYLDARLNAARPCADAPSANTPGGIADMGNNVSEWATAADGAALAMGGNAYEAPRELYALAVLHRRAPAEHRSPYLGFRCVYDAAPSPSPWRAPLAAAMLPPGEYPVGIPPDARLPSLVRQLPADRLASIARMFERGGRRTRDVLHVATREVTRREYAAFLRDPFVLAGFHADPNQPADHTHLPPDWRRQMRQPDLPVVRVDWWSAHAFASWAGGRLPTAQEWERVASGHGERLYPWGDDYAGAAPNTAERRGGGPRAATPADGDATPEGVLALGGNVSEWTRSVSTASGAIAMIVKGGNFLLPGADTARMDYGSHVPPHYRSRTIGFRVVFDRRR